MFTPSYPLKRTRTDNKQISLVADVSFDFTFPSPSIEDPVTPPNMAFSFDPSFLELPYNHGHVRSSSQASSLYSAVSTVESTPDSVCTRVTTPPRASPPVMRHGPLLLPKIRSQDQDIDSARPNAIAAVSRRVHKTESPQPPQVFRSSHARSYTNPETLSNMAFAHMSFPSQREDSQPAPLLCSPASFAHESTPVPEPQQQHQHHARRASSLDAATIEKYGYPTYRQMPYIPNPITHGLPEVVGFPSSYTPREPSPLSMAATPEPASAPTSTLAAFLTAPNPAASLVRTISFPYRDPNTRHFWWDIRSIRSWNAFNSSAIFSLPGASSLLTTPVPSSMLPQPAFTSRHPETEAALHSIYASYYLPKLNSALALSSNRPLQLSVPSSKAPGAMNDMLFVANPLGESATAAAMFGGKPTARVVGLVRSFDRFNTGMRVEGNIKRVEYLRGLSALHHAMREHGCRYGFILTEIELVVVRNGTDTTPYFGDLEVTSFQLASSAETSSESSLTACLALWGLCQLAGDETPAGHARWKSEIGAPAEGTRRKAGARDNWMPQPQLAEKREAKRSRGWVWPEDAIGRKELGKRGVRYGGV